MDLVHGADRFRRANEWVLSMVLTDIGAWPWLVLYMTLTESREGF